MGQDFLNIQYKVIPGLCQLPHLTFIGELDVGHLLLYIFLLYFSYYTLISLSIFLLYIQIRNVFFIYFPLQLSHDYRRRKKTLQ